MGCGGDGGSGELSDDQRSEIDHATRTIGSVCLGFGGDPGEIRESVETLVDIYDDHPDANYAEPGRTDSEPLLDVLQEQQDTLRSECPLDIALAADPESITNVILEHANED